ncbi:MAG: hypothetical protein Q9159_006839 [Coniocarpon cinnabarinum]
MSAPNPNEGRSQWKRGRFGWELVPVPRIAPEDNPFSPHYSEKPQHYQYPPAQHPGLMGSLTSELEHLHLYPHSNSSLLHPQPLPPHAATLPIQDIPGPPPPGYPYHPQTAYGQQSSGYHGKSGHQFPPTESRATNSAVSESETTAKLEERRQHRLPAPHIPRLLKQHGESSKAPSSSRGSRRSRATADTSTVYSESQAGDKSTVHPGSAITQFDKYTFEHHGGVPGPSSDPYETGRQPPKGQEMPEPPPHVAAFCAALPAIAGRIRKSSGYRARTFVAGENTSVKGVRSAADDLEKAFYEDHRGQVFEIEYFKRVCQHMRVDWDDHIENALRCARMRLRQEKRLETIQYPER